MAFSVCWHLSLLSMSLEAQLNLKIRIRNFDIIMKCQTKTAKLLLCSGVAYRHKEKACLIAIFSHAGQQHFLLKIYTHVWCQSVL